MNTYVHLWLYVYIAEFFWWEMFQTKVVEKIKTHILCAVTFVRKSWRLWDNVEKFCTAGQATGNNITRRMHIACWITKTRSRNVILVAFSRQKWLCEGSSVYCLSCFLISLNLLEFKIQIAYPSGLQSTIFFDMNFNYTGRLCLRYTEFPRRLS